MKTQCWVKIGVPLVCLWGWTAVSGERVSTGTDAGRVCHLTAWVDAAAWTTKTEGAEPFAVSSAEGALIVRFGCAKENVGELRLKDPVPVPEDTTGFTFLCGNNGAASSLWIKALVRDASGKEFAFDTTSWHSFEHGLVIPEHSQRRVCMERFVTPGFHRVKVGGGRDATVEGPTPHVKPVPPYTFIGLRFIGNHQRPPTTFTEFFFKNFALTRLDPRNSPFYYQFRDIEGYGELDALPYLTPAHMGKSYGKRFELSWELRDRYDATPFLMDGKTFAFNTTSWKETGGGTDYPLQASQKIEFPVTERGTYWARVRLRWSHDGRSPVPQEIVEREFRLDVVNGGEPVVRRPVSADAMPTTCFIRIVPDRPSVIFDASEPFAVNVAFRNPGPAFSNAYYRATVYLSSGEQEIRSQVFSPVWGSHDLYVAAMDLNDLPAGTYKIRAEIAAEKQVFDQVERVIARKGVADTAAGAVGAIPATVPSWKEMLDSPKPMFHLTPMLPDNLPQDSAKAWTNYYRPFLDKAATLSTQIEFSFHWDTVEPLPGIFDWGFVDRFVDYAQSKGLTVQLWPSFRDLPEWIPARYEMSSEGQVFGGRGSYQFHGGRPNYVNAPEIHAGIIEFIGRVARRYRTNPTVQSYFFCFEHPGDAPYAGWYEGYAPESVQAFRRGMQTAHGSLEVLNRRWGTSYTAWEEIVPPAREASSRYRLDWLQFKTRGIEGLLRDCVTAIRSADPKRLIDMYGDGASDVNWFHEQGCMSANGGSHDAMAMPTYAALALAGFPQRTEDHSPGNWSAYFPSQLDASVFAMMAGGGANAHCKAYIFTKNRFADMADPDVSLGRYKRFMPIWTELRATETAQPVSAFFLNSRASFLVEANTTFGVGGASPWNMVSFSQAQVPVAAGLGNLWEHGKWLFAVSSLKTCDMEPEMVDRIVAYVENGGTLLMSADTGRRSIDVPAEDWVLLRRFGVRPPTEEQFVPNRNTLAAPVQGTVFAEDAKPFTLREIWNVAPPEGCETSALFEGDPQRAALSWKSFGKGKVAVLWAQTIVPPMFSQPQGAYPFLRDLARWSGIAPMASVSDDRLWTNLLRTKDGSTYYGLVHVGSWQGTPSVAVGGAVRWLVLPEGEYRVSELIGGKTVGDFSAAALRSDGIPVQLGPREVAIFRMVRK